jgi:hypothetical protein
VATAELPPPPVVRRGKRFENNESGAEYLAEGGGGVGGGDELLSAWTGGGDAVDGGAGGGASSLPSVADNLGTGPGQQARAHIAAPRAHPPSSSSSSSFSAGSSSSSSSATAATTTATTATAGLSEDEASLAAQKSPVNQALNQLNLVSEHVRQIVRSEGGNSAPNYVDQDGAGGGAAAGGGDYVEEPEGGGGVRKTPGGVEGAGAAPSAGNKHQGRAGAKPQGRVGGRGANDRSGGGVKGGGGHRTPRGGQRGSSSSSNGGGSGTAGSVSSGGGGLDTANREVLAEPRRSRVRREPVEQQRRSLASSSSSKKKKAKSDTPSSLSAASASSSSSSLTTEMVRNAVYDNSCLQSLDLSGELSANPFQWCDLRAEEVMFMKFGGYELVTPGRLCARTVSMVYDATLRLTSQDRALRVMLPETLYGGVYKSLYRQYSYEILPPTIPPPPAPPSKSSRHSKKQVVVLPPSGLYKDEKVCFLIRSAKVHSMRETPGVAPSRLVKMDIELLINCKSYLL